MKLWKGRFSKAENSLAEDLMPQLTSIKDYISRTLLAVLPMLRC